MVQELQRLASGVQSGPRSQRLLENLAFAIQFRPAGGEESYLSIAARQVAVGRGKHPKPTVVLEGPSQDLAQVLLGARDVTHFIAEGKVRVTGNYYHAIDLSRLALAVRQAGAAA